MSSPICLGRKCGHDWGVYEMDTVGPFKIECVDCGAVRKVDPTPTTAAHIDQLIYGMEIGQP